MTNLGLEPSQPGSRAHALDLYADIVLEATTESSPCWVIVKTNTLETTEFGPPVYPERQSGASHQGLRCVCLGWVCHVGHPGMLRAITIHSPDQGSHSFFQIENQPWGFRLLIESASDCGCSNYSCEVPLGPATQRLLSAAGLAS